MDACIVCLQNEAPIECRKSICPFNQVHSAAAVAMYCSDTINIRTDNSSINVSHITLNAQADPSIISISGEAGGAAPTPALQEQELLQPRFAVFKSSFCPGANKH